LASGLALLLIWQVMALLMTGSARRFLLPSPGAVVRRFVRLLQDGTLAHHTGVTLLEMGLGLLLGTTLALLLGYAIAHSRLLAYLLEPIIVISQAVPIVAIAPLLTVWLGPGLASKVVVCALIVFFPILVNVVMGLKSIEPQLRDLFRLLEATPGQTLRHLEIPAAMPTLMSGLKVGGTLAGMGAVVGEFVASSEGLGYLIKQGQNLYDLPMMFVAILTLMVIALSVYSVLSLLERRTRRWRTPDPTMSKAHKV
jgi:NitT/TauT family transport system permease protein